MVAESMDIILKLWSTDPPLEYNGKYWNISLHKNVEETIGMGVIHKPFQKPHPPIIVGGAFPHGAKRAIAYGDGWIPHAKRPAYDSVIDKNEKELILF